MHKKRVHAEDECTYLPWDSESFSIQKFAEVQESRQGSILKMSKQIARENKIYVSNNTNKLWGLVIIKNV